MDDLISRQAAIDAINKAFIRVFNEMIGESVLKNVPSAQPEIIMCKDCKHNSLKRVSGNVFCDLGHAFSQLHDFCSDSERRER